MKKLFFAALLFFSFSCNTKQPEGIGDKLKAALQHHLEEGHQGKPVKYEVLTVNYFEEADYYNCEFKVKQTYKETDTSTVLKDTIGSMAATVSKDFKTISRKY